MSPQIEKKLHTRSSPQRFVVGSIVVFLMMICAHVGFADDYENEWENISNSKSNSNSTNSAQAEVEKRKLGRDQSDEADDMEEEVNSRGVRKFHEVLDELLAEFGYDVKMGQLNGLKNLAIRRVDVSDSLPTTYKSYLEMLVSERIRENSRVRLISCVTCRSKSSHLVEGRLMITSPTTNIDRMKEAAQQMGIDQFMDVVLVYHTTHMVLAMEVFNATTQELVWTRTYNSETIKSRFQKLAIDYKQVEQSRPGDDYKPEYRVLLGVGGGIIPNINNSSNDNGMISLLARSTERFDNRRHEFGLQSNIYIRKDAVLGNSSSSANAFSLNASNPTSLRPAASVSDLTPWTYGLTLYGIYARHFVGKLESYNEIRHGLNVGVGFLVSTGFLTTSLRTGWDIYFGRRYSTNFSLVYFAPTTVTVGDESVRTTGGVGGEFTISTNL